MIRAEELRIGNYLKSLDVCVVQIDALSIYHIWDESKEYNPIPLTEDWLVKFGFNKNHISYYKDLLPFPTEYKKILVDINQGIMVRAGEINKSRINDELIVLWNCDIRGKIHVHQLQNLFHSLTGKELELK